MFARLWRADWGAITAVVRLALPISATALAESGLSAAAALMMGALGMLELAAHGIALSVASVTFMLFLGLANAATVRAGQSVGHRDQQGLRDGARAVIILCGAVALSTMAMFLLIPEVLISLFMDPAEPNKPAVLAVGVTLMAAAALLNA